MVSLVHGVGVRSARTRSANQELSAALTNGTNVLLVELGDSRTAQKGTIRWEEVLLQAAPSITWGGCRQEVQGINRTGKYTIGSPGLILGDAKTPCSGTLAGKYAQDYFPGDWMRWVDTQISDPAGAWFAYYVDKWKQAKLPLLWQRALSLGSTTASVYFPVIGGVTPSANLKAGWAVDRFTVSGQTFGSAVNPVADQYSIASATVSMDYSMETNKCPTMVHEGVMAVGTLAFSAPVVVACDGVRAVSLAVPGRSIAGWADDEILTDFHLSVQIPALMTAVGATQCIPIIALGANYPADILAAATFEERVELHKGYMSTLVSRWRAQTGQYLVAVDTSYIDPAEKDLPDSYFAVASRQFAAENAGVALIDSSAAMGSWYDMQAAGLLEPDGLHLTDAGRLVLAGVFSDEVDRYAS